MTDASLVEPSHYPFDMPYGWFQVAWSHELAPGEVIPRYYYGRHLVLWRDEHGTPHLQDAYCPHLGAHLAYGGIVKGCELQCPFHGWRFDGTGANTAIPYGNRTNQKARIRTYELREMGDHLILAWFHPHDVEPIFEIEPPDEVTSPDFGAWTSRHFSVSAAPQELQENSVDGPHFRYVHDTEIVPEIESYTSEGPVSRMRSIQKFPTPRGVVDGRIDVDNFGPGFSVTRFSGIVDTFLIGAAVPVTPNRTEVRFSFKTRSLGDESMTAGVSQAFVSEVCKQFEQDRPIWENKAHIARPALADTDPPFMKFRSWYSQFYADGVNREVAVWPKPVPTEQFQPERFTAREATASAAYRSSE